MAPLPLPGVTTAAPPPHHGSRAGPPGAMTEQRHLGWSGPRRYLERLDHDDYHDPRRRGLARPGPALPVHSGPGAHAEGGGVSPSRSSPLPRWTDKSPRGPSPFRHGHTHPDGRRDAQNAYTSARAELAASWSDTDATSSSTCVTM